MPKRRKKRKRGNKPHGHGHGGGQASGGRPGGQGGGGQGGGGQTATSGGLPNPVIQPFLTADDLMAQDAARAERENLYADLDAMLARMAAEHGLEYENISRDVRFGKRDTDFEMAGRGLHQSSLRDAELYDIDATASLRKNYLETEFQTATLDAQRQKHAADQAWTTFQARMQQQAVENAQEASAGMPEMAVDRPMGPPPTPGFEGDAGNQPRPPRPGGGHGSGGQGGHGGHHGAGGRRQGQRGNRRRGHGYRGLV